MFLKDDGMWYLLKSRARHDRENRTRSNESAHIQTCQHPNTYSAIIVIKPGIVLTKNGGKVLHLPDSKDGIGKSHSLLGVA